jgi:hypothetical protein
MSNVGGLDPDDPLCGKSTVQAAVVIGGGTLAGTALLAGLALRLADERAFRRGYLWALAVTLLVASVVAWYVLGRGTAMVFTALSAGPFVLLWGTANQGWERRAALAGLAFLGGMAVASIADIL